MNYSDLFKDFFNFKTTVVANGRFPFHPFLLELIKSSQTLICCDGAVAKLQNFGLKPCMIVGDGDSLSADLKQNYASILHLDTNQDLNDLCKSIAFCRSRNLNNILIFGATGLREDHSLGNIFHLEDFSDLNVKMLTDYGVFELVQSRQIIPSVKGQQISIFSLDKNDTITSSGLKYPLRQTALSALWCGTLNEAVSTEFSLTFHQKHLLVFRSFEVK